MENNLVVFKGRKDGITVELNGESSFEELRDSLNHKIMNTRQFFNGARMTVNFKGRRLEAEEEDELLSIITNAYNTQAVKKEPIAFKGKDSRRREREAKQPDRGGRQFIYEGMSVIHQGSLRSGQSIRYPGSVVVIGDINPGAEVIVEGSVTVFGSIKGMVHAGCAGDRGCFIAAIKIEPIQLRISDIVTYVPQSYIAKNKNKLNPSYAYVMDDQIYIAPL